ncbi:hypothetical protein D3C87_2154300 [compost metagenome]
MVCPACKRSPLYTGVSCQSSWALNSIGRWPTGLAAHASAGMTSSGMGGRCRRAITEHSRLTSSIGLSGSL